MKRARWTRDGAARLSGWALVTSCATMGVAASCSDTANIAAFDDHDAASNGGDADGNGNADGDAATTDAQVAERDAGTSDAGPLPVACGSPPCATALVSTLSEGFCALLGDGTVACWGQNTNAELGRGDEAEMDDSAMPARVVGVEHAVTLAHTCAIDADGATWCWGTGPWLRDPDFAATTEPTPVKLAIPAATMLDVTDTTACAVVDGGVVCWGANTNGQVAIPEFGVDPNAPLLPRAIPLPPGAPVRALAVSRAAFVLRTDGTAASWGRFTPLARISSLAPDPYPETIPLTGIFGIATVADNACAVVEGVAHCWGSPLFTGVDTPAEPLPQRSMPAPMATPEPVGHIATTASVEPDWSTGAPAMAQRACAASVSGAVYCWGTNSSGQVGDGTTDYAHGFVAVTGLPAPAARVATTPRTTCALLTNGKVFCWGDRSHGQVGDGTIGSPSPAPKEVVLP